MTRRVRRPTVAAIAIALALAGIATGCPSSDTSGAPDATTTSGGASTDHPAAGPAPEKGACLEPMTSPIADGHQLPSLVPCSQPHGGEVVDVLRLDLDDNDPYPAWGQQLDGADDQLETCRGTATERGDLAKFLGSKPIALADDLAASSGVTSAFPVSGAEYAFYVPGPAAWSNGARWFVCAAVLNNHLKTPSSYTGSLRNALGKPGSLPDEFSWCKTAEPSASRGDFEAVPCTEPHNYEQLVTFTAGADDATFPGSDALEALSQAVCPAASSAATGGRTDQLPTGIGLGWTFPLESEWTVGDRTVRCFAVTEQGDSTGAVGAGTSSLTSG